MMAEPDFDGRARFREWASRRLPMKTRTAGAEGPPSGRNRRAIGWGFVDQSLSSVTNLGLSLLAGRLLGPAGLGKVFLGFSVYLLALNLQRKLLTEPLLTATSALGHQRRSRTAAEGLTMCVGLGFLFSIGVLLLAMTLLRGFADRGLLLVVPWLIPALIQDFWRNVLFRDHRASAAAANDCLWFVVMVLTIPIVRIWPSDWAVMAWWGVGAFAGALYGFLQARVFLSPPGAAWRWFRTVAWPFGKWNAGAFTLTSIGTQLATFVVVGILGASSLGGLRAATTVFAPLSLIIPALALPGLPAVARAHTAGVGRKVALDFSALAVAASAAYFLMLLLGGWRLLPLVFGTEFTRYRSLIWPVTVAQIAAAAEVGSLLLIKAQQRGRILMLTQAITAVVDLVLAVVFALRYGLVGVAWAGAAGNVLSMCMLSFSAFRKPRPSHISRR